MYEKAALRTIFQKQYDPQVWKNMMRDFFDAEIRTTPQQLDLPGCDDMGFYLGDKELQNGLKLGFFHFQINSGNVLRKRVGLRNLVNPFLKYDVDAAIVVFSDLKHWRLSFISDFGKDATAPKRFTYVFGDSTQFYNTPANRLYDLQGKELSLGVLYDTFSVESLSDEFFTEYKKLYLELCDFVNEHRTDTDYFGAEFASWEEKHIRDYVKKLMGRLVFLQFVQKKGWLGDNANYLRKLFKNSAPQKQDNFLDQVLEPLFFGVFNTQPQSRQENFLNNGWDLSLLEQWKSVPFLSGGLFEMDKHDVPTSRFPKEYFEELFDFFAQYNFTIDENDPNDAEVGVDPEMLGKIFENLLEDNKDKGAYYTPKEIVHYMSCESVIQYLKSHTDESLHADIERLVNCNELGDTIREMKNAKQIGQLLKAVKVCDPAIGSGAFPMGVLNVIFNCRRTMLEELTAERFDDYVRIKKDIIQNNIYGVDIEQGAVDIARLRFWLALLVDAKEPEALPNLNYKIMRGNSLIPTFDGQYIDLEVKGEYDAGKQRCLQELLGLQSSFYTLVSDEKCKAEIRIKQLILDIVAMQIGKELRAWDEQHAVQGNIFEPRNMEDLKKILPEEKLNVIRKGQRIRDRLNDESVSLQERASTDLDFFDWHIMFSDVFENNGGFDIVIGNPPYIKEYNNRSAFDGFRETSPYYMGKMDLWYGFACHGIDLLSKDGIITFIAQNNWTTSAGAVKMRDKIVHDTKIIQMIDFNDYMVFGDSASIQTMVMVFQHCNYIDNYVIDYRKLKANSCKSDMLELLANNHVTQTDIRHVDFKRDSHIGKYIVFDGKQVLFDKISSGKEYFSKEEIAQGIVFPQDFVDKKRSQILGSDFKVGDGIFGLSDNELSELSLTSIELSLIKPYYTTEEIKRYITYPKNHLWMIYTDSSYSNPSSLNDCPNLKSHLDKFQSIITSCYKPYGLHRARKESLFKGEKIVALRKCVGKPSFSYSDFDCYVTQTFNVIKTNRWNLKFLLGLLNSSLVSYWLKCKGKLQGNNYQVDKEPLQSIPLPMPVPIDIESEIIKLVDAIIETKRIDYGADSSIYECRIDRLVYELYGLTEEEIVIVEEATR